MQCGRTACAGELHLSRSSIWTLMLLPILQRSDCLSQRISYTNIESGTRRLWSSKLFNQKLLFWSIWKKIYYSCNLFMLKIRGNTWTTLVTSPGHSAWTEVNRTDRTNFFQFSVYFGWRLQTDRIFFRFYFSSLLGSVRRRQTDRFGGGKPIGSSVLFFIAQSTSSSLLPHISSFYSLPRHRNSRHFPLSKLKT